MILSNPQRQETMEALNLWGKASDTHTLDGLLRKNAQQKPDNLAITDAPDRRSWTNGDARQLSWVQYNEQVSAFAIFLKGLDLPTDSVIALYGPNTTDMLISILGIHRAGFIAAPIPVFWRKQEMLAYLGEIQARVLITGQNLEDDDLALRCRNLAQELFSIKYILGYGDNLPDGIVDIESILESARPVITSQNPFSPLDPNAIMTIHPADLQTSKLEIAIPRSSNQWLATHRAFLESANTADKVLCPFPFSGLAGFTVGLVHALKTGATLHLHHFQGQGKLVEHLSDTKPDLTVLPSEIAKDIIEATPDKSVEKLALIWKNHHLDIAPQRLIRSNIEIIDITLLNGICGIGILRSKNTDRPINLPLNGRSGLISLTLYKPNMRTNSVLSGGELVVEGASVPDTLFPTNDEQRALYRLRNRNKSTGLRTNIACRTGSDTKPGAEPIGLLASNVGRQYQIISTEELDELYARVSGLLNVTHIYDAVDQSLHAIGVTEAGRKISYADFIAALRALDVSDAKIPDTFTQVEKIEYGHGNTAFKSELLEEIQQLRTAGEFIQSEQKKISA